MYTIITILISSILISIFFRKGKVQQELFNFNQTQYLKGIAILIIILCHTIGQAKETVIATPLGGIGVAMFLFPQKHVSVGKSREATPCWDRN